MNLDIQSVEALVNLWQSMTWLHDKAPELSDNFTKREQGISGNGVSS